MNTLKSMWELKERYLGYRLFVWLKNGQGVNLFTRLMLSGIRVEGFCSDEGTELTTFLGKPVIVLDKMADEPDALIIYWNEEAGVELKEKTSDMQFLCFSYGKLFELRREIREGKNVIFYDSRQEAERVAALLQKHDAVVWANCAVKENHKPNVPGRNICQKELMEQVWDYNFILASGETYYERSLTGLDDRGLDIFVPAMDILYKAEQRILLGNPGWYLDRAMREHKKIILYGAESCFTNSCLSFLDALDIEVAAVLDDSGKEREGVGSIYDLAYENPSNVYVIVNKAASEVEKSCDFLDSLGFGPFNHKYTGLYAVCCRHLAYKEDITLGYVAETLLENQKYPGFRVYGKEGKADLRIVTLGGSTTTSEGGRTPCWPQLLYERFQQEGKNVTIYNGGVDGYDAGNELYKLLRDVGNLYPSLVISFSGINNISKDEHPYVPKHLNSIFEAVFQEDYCRGLKNDAMSAAQIWVQQEQMMHAISTNVYNAEFVCFVQPTYISKDVLTIEERLKYELDLSYRKSALAFRKEASQLAKQYEWMVDLQDMLDEKPQVFMDSAHVYEEGNRLIASTIYHHIEKRQCL